MCISLHVRLKGSTRLPSDELNLHEGLSFELAAACFYAWHKRWSAGMLRKTHMCVRMCLFVRRDGLEGLEDRHLSPQPDAMR